MGCGGEGMAQLMKCLSWQPKDLSVTPVKKQTTNKKYPSFDLSYLKFGIKMPIYFNIFKMFSKIEENDNEYLLKLFVDLLILIHIFITLLRILYIVFSSYPSLLPLQFLP